MRSFSFLPAIVVSMSFAWSARAGQDKEKKPPGVAELRRLLADPDATVRARALDQVNAQPRLVGELVDEIFLLGNDGDKLVRQRAMHAVGQLLAGKIQAAKALDMLRARFKDPVPEVRLAAIDAALRARAGQAEAASVLIEFLRGKNPDPYFTLYLLTMTGEHGKAAQPDLVKLIKTDKSEEGNLGFMAFETMQALKLDLKPVLPDLVQRYGSKTFEIIKSRTLSKVFADHGLPDAVVVKPLLMSSEHSSPVFYENDFFQKWPERFLRGVISCLPDPEARVRHQAAAVLAVHFNALVRERVPPEAEKILEKLVDSKEMIDHLRANLKDKDPLVYWYAAAALASTRTPGGKDLVPLVLQWLKKDMPPRPLLFDQVFENLAGEILALDPDRAASLVYEEVGTGNAFTRENYAKATRGLPAKTLRPLLTRSLKEGKDLHKLYALSVLNQLPSTTAKEVNEALLFEVSRALKDVNATVRLKAADLLVSHPARDLDSILAVAVELLEDKDLRLDGIALLYRLRYQAASARPALVKVLDDPDPVVHLRAAEVLLEITPRKVEEILPILQRHLEKPKVPHIHQVFTLVSRLGSAGKPLAPSLLPLVQDKKSEFRVSAALSLLHVDPGQTGPALPIAMDFVDRGQAQQVLPLLRLLGPAAKPAMPALQKAFEKANPRQRPALAVTMAAIDPSDKNPPMRFLRETLAGKTKNGMEDQIMVLDILEEMGPSSKVFLPELTALLKTEKDTAVLEGVVYVLIAIGPEARETVAMLEELAKTAKSKFLRAQIKEAIPKIAGPAQDKGQEGERLFRTMERKVHQAQTLKIVVEAVMRAEGKDDKGAPLMKAVLFAGPDNQLRIESNTT